MYVESDPEPILELRDIFRSSWSVDNVPYSKQPPIHTGWYGDVDERPQVTVGTKSDPTESTETVGYNPETGKDAVQVSGTVRVSGWGASRPILANDDSATTGSPKELSRAFRWELNRILSEFSDGSRDAEGNYVFTRLSEDSARRLIDDEREDTVVRWEVTAAYQYRTLR